MASRRASGTRCIWPKSATSSPCFFLSCRRNSSRLISIELRPLRSPNLASRPKGLPDTELCNPAMPLSILRRLEAAGNPPLYQVLSLGCTGMLPPSEQGVAQVAAVKPAYYLTGEIFSVNCIFLYGYSATNRSLGSRSRLRLPAARSGLLLRPLPAQPFRR